MLNKFHHPQKIEAGCDEAGRGCLAGPVFAAAVILPKDFFHPILNDSKKLSEKDRDQLRPIIIEKALAWSVARVDPQEIDEINIFNASYLAMHRAVDSLNILPESLLIDGKYFNPHPQIPHHCFVKGDSKYAAIAAASILAKTFRDEYMTSLDKEYPIYLWKQNKGYPTKAHRSAIALQGPSPYHRKSFKLLPDDGGEQIKLF